MAGHNSSWARRPRAILATAKRLRPPSTEEGSGGLRAEMLSTRCRSIMRKEREDGMGMDDYRDREGDSIGEGDRDAGWAGLDYRDIEGDAEARTGLGNDLAGVDDDFTDTASLGGDPAGG
jgi:hypothetical protein